ncbi:hypothetical protein NFI96_032360 [Prochilodus magdalenae]|nr:hypothetical protein NFI96_032360 [Prochilodus magdalenae]
MTGAVSIRAACHRSMRKGEKPHSLTVALGLDSASGLGPCRPHFKSVLMCSWHCSVEPHSCFAVSNSTLFRTECTSRAPCPHLHRDRTAMAQAQNIEADMGVKPGPINKMVITKPRLNRLSEGGIRSTLYKGLVGDPLDLSLLQIGDTYKDLDIKEKPQLWASVMKTLVETAFGMAQKVSVLSYLLPILPTKSVKVHQDAPPYPPLPPEECRLHPTQCVHVCI